MDARACYLVFYLKNNNKTFIRKMAVELEMSGEKTVKLSANKGNITLNNRVIVIALITTDSKQRHGLVTDTIAEGDVKSHWGSRLFRYCY